MGSLKSQFSVYVGPNSMVNTTKFTLTLLIYENDNVYFGFVIVAMGRQP